MIINITTAEDLYGSSILAAKTFALHGNARTLSQFYGVIRYLLIKHASNVSCERGRHFDIASSGAVAVPCPTEPSPNCGKMPAPALAQMPCLDPKYIERYALRAGEVAEWLKAAVC